MRLDDLGTVGGAAADHAGEPLADLALIIPLKALSDAKTRLSSALDRAQRQDLMVRMFNHVVSVCRLAPSVQQVVVVAGDDAAASVAGVHGVGVLTDPGGGLNAAVAEADRRCADAPATMVLAADLPHVSVDEVELMALLGASGPCVLVAPTSDGGTGALLRRPGGLIPPAYGRSSCARHLRTAQAMGVRSARVHLPGLAHDVDRPGDLGGVDAALASRSYAPAPSTSGPG